MEDIEYKKAIIAFIKSKTGVLVDDSTVLFSKLELIGLDADTFIDDFSKKFNVDFETLKYDDYFVNISSIPFYCWYLKHFSPEKLKRKEFNLDHLVEVVKKGKWFDPM